MTMKAISMKVDAKILERADSLIQRLHEDEQLGMLMRANRSSVLRLALSEGTKALEQKWSRVGVDGDGPPMRFTFNPGTKRDNAKNRKADPFDGYDPLEGNRG